MEYPKSEKIKFVLEKPVKGEFLFDTPKTGTHDEFGDWFMYKVRDYMDQREKIFYASKKLNEKLMAHVPLQGKEFTITKVLMKDENGNYVERKGQPMAEFKVEVTSVAGLAIDF